MQKGSFFFSLAIPAFGFLSHISSLRLSSGHSGLILTLRTDDAAHTSLPSTSLLVAVTSIWVPSPLAVVVRRFSYGFFFFFPPGYVALGDSKTPHRPVCERVSCCVETSASQLPPQDGSLSLDLLPLILSFIFCPTSFRRGWAAFLDGGCPPPVFKSCFVIFAQRSNDLLMNLWGRKWSPGPIPPPSWDRPLGLIGLIFLQSKGLSRVFSSTTV